MTYFTADYRIEKHTIVKRMHEYATSTHDISSDHRAKLLGILFLDKSRKIKLVITSDNKKGT